MAVPHPDTFYPSRHERVTEHITTVVHVQGPGVRLRREGIELRGLASARREAKAAVADPREVNGRPRDDAVIIDVDVQEFEEPRDG
jgi:hypothetical protein